jgi:hypothetical protein
MNSFFDKAKDLIHKNPDKAEEALDKAENVVNEKTGNKYTSQVEAGADKIGDALGIPDKDKPA